jgi:cytochrome c biogenesis protein CcmG/thiol:disulfide interchange protein DsbE
MKQLYLLLLLFSFGSIVPACSKTDSKPPAKFSADLNATAPDFTLKDLSGGDISLADYRGKVVLLEFWATWCPPCKASVPALVKLEKKYEQKGFTVVGLAMDSDSDASEKVRQFSASSHINYPVILSDEATKKLYNVISIPTSFLIGRDGKIVDIYKGYSDEFENRIAAQIEKLI